MPDGGSLCSLWPGSLQGITLSSRRRSASSCTGTCRPHSHLYRQAFPASECQAAFTNVHLDYSDDQFSGLSILPQLCSYAIRRCRSRGVQNVWKYTAVSVSGAWVKGWRVLLFTHGVPFLPGYGTVNRTAICEFDSVGW